MSQRTTYEPVPRPPLPEGVQLVIGLARSGQAAVKALCARGHRVIAVDARSPEGSDTLGDFGAEVYLGTSGEEFVELADVIVKSPGVPQDAPAVAAAHRAGKPVIGELELGWRMIENPVIAVTGTNGKTTTVELLGQIFRDAGLPVVVAGNVGTALCELVDTIGPDAMLILEASSYQLEDAPLFTPECGILLNVAPDHIDRHGSMDAYRAAKLTMFERQQAGQFAVVGPTVSDAIPGAGRQYRVPAADLERIGDSIALPGPHNKENALIATQAAMLMGVDPLSISRTIATFGGLPHRMELVGVHDGVRFVNDSKATNVAATLAALDGFAGDARLILGGAGKGEDYGPLVAALNHACSGVYLNGGNAGELAQALQQVSVPVSTHATLEQAFAAATAEARTGETVLLSPAAASFDQFRDYEARGERFGELAKAL